MDGVDIFWLMAGSGIVLLAGSSAVDGLKEHFKECALEKLQRAQKREHFSENLRRNVQAEESPDAIVESLVKEARRLQREGTPEASKGGGMRYVTLGLMRPCSLKELGSAYDSKTRLWHPNRVACLPSEAREVAGTMMLEVEIAYHSLRSELFEAVGRNTGSATYEDTEPTESTHVSSYPVEIFMPSFGGYITEGTLKRWLKRPGDLVAIDEPIFEISTNKVDAEIPSPAPGVLGEIKVRVGTTVGVGTLICTIREIGVKVPEPERPLWAQQDQRYVLLKATPGCTLRELRAAYYHEAALWHPDKVAHLAPGLQEYAKNQMILINDAYQSLRSEVIPFEQNEV